MEISQHELVSYPIEIVLSSRYHYCCTCEKSFKTAAGLRVVHMRNSIITPHLVYRCILSITASRTSCLPHDDDDYSDDDKPDSWEDEVTFLENHTECLRQMEDEIFADDEEESRLSPIQRYSCVLPPPLPPTRYLSSFDVRH